MKEYSNKEVKVLWDPEKCIHARECVKGLPEVFCRDSTPSIVRFARGGASEEIMKIVDRCPSGALTSKRWDRKMGKSVNSPCAKIKVMKNGPLLVEGGCSLVDNEGKELAGRGSYALCRCGRSGKKPLCDGTHTRIGFAIQE